MQSTGRLPSRPLFWYITFRPGPCPLEIRKFCYTGGIRQLKCTSAASIRCRSRAGHWRACHGVNCCRLFQKVRKGNHAKTKIVGRPACPAGPAVSAASAKIARRARARNPGLVVSFAAHDHIAPNFRQRIKNLRAKNYLAILPFSGINAATIQIERECHVKDCRRIG